MKWQFIFGICNPVYALSLQILILPSTVAHDSWFKPVVDKHKNILHAEHDVFLSLHVVEGIKKTAISQAKSSIASEHTKNTCDLSYAAPLEIERERVREKKGERRRKREKVAAGEVDETESTDSTFFSANRLLN